MEQLEAIKANAGLVIEKLTPNAGPDFGFDAASVEWLDGFIERHRENWDEATRGRMTSILGSYLGECVRVVYGGEWVQNEYGLAIAFDENNAAFPFNKIEKHIANGSDDSIYSFFTSIGAVFGPDRA